MMQKTLILGMFLVCIAFIQIETRMTSLRDEMKVIKSDKVTDARALAIFEENLLKKAHQEVARLASQHPSAISAGRDDLKALSPDNFKQGLTSENP